MRTEKNGELLDCGSVDGRTGDLCFYLFIYLSLFFGIFSYKFVTNIYRDGHVSL